MLVASATERPWQQRLRGLVAAPRTTHGRKHSWAATGSTLTEAHLVGTRGAAAISSASLPLTKLQTDTTVAHPARASTTDEMGTVVDPADPVSPIGTMRARSKLVQLSDTLTASDEWAPRARAVPTPPSRPSLARANRDIAPGANVPSLATLERVAGNALYFEQYYDALARCPRPKSRLLRAQRTTVDIKAFDLGRVIGQGAFGVVHIATERRRGRIVAIKQLRKIDLLRMGQEGHVRAEKDLLSAAANLPGVRWIPSLHYAFQDRDHLFLVLEYMGGGDLLTLFMTRGTLPEEMMRYYAAEMILALHQVHSLGYIHRDVKPDNFLFTSDGHIRIADFGLATDLHWAHDSSYYEHQRRAVLKRHGVPLARPAFGNRRRRIETGPNASPPKPKLLAWRKTRRRLAYTICGTNSYMAPEVIRGQGYGFGADWWGLGIIGALREKPQWATQLRAHLCETVLTTVYEGLFGTVPFVGASRQAARQRILDWKVNLKFPKAPRASPLAMDFMRKLLCEPGDRLGATVPVKRRGSMSSGVTVAAAPAGADADAPLGHDGVERLKAHPWFFGIDWDRLHTMRAPYAPNLACPADTQHFDEDIPNEPLAPANSALDLRDPLLGNSEYGAAAIAIRKEAWTYRSPSSLEDDSEVVSVPTALVSPPCRTTSAASSNDAGEPDAAAESSGVLGDDTGASRRALYAPSHTTGGITDDATSASRRGLHGASDTGSASDVGSVPGVPDDVFHDAETGSDESDGEIEKKLGLARETDDVEELQADGDLEAYIPRHARTHPSYGLQPRAARVGPVRGRRALCDGEYDGADNDDDGPVSNNKGREGQTGESVMTNGVNGDRDAAARVGGASARRDDRLWSLDRGADLVRWEEIVADTAAAEAAAPASAASVAVARRTPEGRDADSDAPSGTTLQDKTKPRRRRRLTLRRRGTRPAAARRSVAVT